MKLIHCADIHLGSALSARLPREKAQLRKNELRQSLRAMVDYAREQEIGVILLSGDVFDSDHPSKKDKAFFYSVVKNNPTIDFLYLKGNHDQAKLYDEELPNLKTFGAAWQCYRYGCVAIWGLELGRENMDTLYDTLSLSPADTNVVMLHGQVSDSTGEDRIVLPRLRSKGIDYLALGHIHSYTLDKLDERGIWCYSGCLEGRGYDEPGEKGFVVLDTEDPRHPVFHPQSQRVIRKVEVDISGCEDEYQVSRRVAEFLPEKEEDYLRLELIGEIAFDGGDLTADLTGALEGRYFGVSVKNRTVRRFDIQEYEDEISLAGEFIRQVRSLSLPAEEEQAVMDLGLRALSGREVGL